MEKSFPIPVILNGPMLLKTAKRRLFISECYMFEKVIRAHLSLSTLKEKLPTPGTGALSSHMSDDMLSRA
jgi:hypothetical protein